MKLSFKLTLVLFVVFCMSLVTLSVGLFKGQTPDVSALVSQSLLGEPPAPAAWALRFHQEGDESMGILMANAGNGVIMPVFEYTEAYEPGEQTLLKVNQNGSLIWQQTLWHYPALLLQIVPTTDGGYIALSRPLLGGISNFGISKLDPAGNEVWSKTYNLPDYAETHSQYIQQTADGGYIMTGFGTICSFFQCIPTAMVVIKVDALGNILWVHDYDAATGLGEIKSVQETADGGYLFHTSPQVVKLDSQGLVSWAKQVGYHPSPQMQSVQQLEDGGYILTGTHDGGTEEFYCWAMRLNTDGSVAWEKTYTTSYDVVWASANLEIVEDGFILSCNLWPDPNNQDDRDFALLKLDGNGDIVWQKRYGSSSVDGVVNAVATEDGSLFVGGYSNSFGAGDYDVMLWRLDANGDICTCDFVHEEDSFIAVETDTQVTDLAVTAQDVVVTTEEFQLLDNESEPFLSSFLCMAPQEEVTAVITPAGGSLISGDGQTAFIFPGGAFTETVSLTYFHWYDQDVNGFGRMNRTFELTAVYSDTQQPATLAPNQTFTVMVHYGQSGAGTIIEETMALYAWQDDQWVLEGSSTLDTETKTLTAVPDHLGWFAVLGETNQVQLPVVLKSLWP